MTVGLKPLLDAYGIEYVHATTLQAISGSGFPGLSHAEMYDNCVPYIGQEEDKMEEEAAKILGTFDGSGIVHTDMKVSAICNRVPVSNGHAICVSVKLKNWDGDVEKAKQVNWIFGRNVRWICLMQAGVGRSSVISHVHMFSFS